MADQMPPGWQNAMLAGVLGPVGQDGPATCRLITGTPRTEGLKVDEASYETGHREGENSRTADILLLFSDARTMDDLLAGFREVMVNPDLEWPEQPDWRAMFAKYARIVEACEGVTFLSRPGFGTPGAEEEWTPEEWAAIEEVVRDD